MRLAEYSSAIACALPRLSAQPDGAVLLVVELDSRRGVDLEIDRLASSGMSRNEACARVERQFRLACANRRSGLAVNWCDAAWLAAALGEKLARVARRLLESNVADPIIVFVHARGVEVVGHAVTVATH
jgi:hypothetical protein